MFYEQLLSRRSLVLSEEMNQIVAVHSLGNCALVDPCILMLEPFVQFKTAVSTQIRLHAIYAMLGAARKVPHRIRQLVLPIFKDIRESVELRLAAYLAFMSSRPSQSDLLLVAKTT